MTVPRHSARCVLCPDCGVWIVIGETTATRLDQGGKGRTSLVMCPNPQCSQPRFRVRDEDMQKFALPAEMLKRGYFDVSDVHSLEHAA